MTDSHKTNTKKFSRCPYRSIGCDFDKETKDKVTTHLHKEELVHARILIECIEEMNKKMSTFNENLNKQNKELLLLKEDSKLKEIQTTKQMVSLEEILRDKEIKINKQSETIEHIWNDINLIKEEERQKEEEIQLLKEEVANLKLELNDKNKIIEDQRRDIETLKNEETIEQDNVSFIFNVLKSEINEIKMKEHGEKDSAELKTNMNINELTTDVNKYPFDENSYKTIEDLKQIIEKMDVWTHEKFMVGEVLFSIDRFSIRRISEEVIFSPYFYSHKNGYKLRLKVYPGGDLDGKGTHLSLFFVICKGEYDDELSWPCKHSIKISIINQFTKEDQVSLTFDYLNVEDKFKYHFVKPTTKNNDGLGFSLLISLKDLETIAGLIVNDVVVVKCSI